MSNELAEAGRAGLDAYDEMRDVLADSQHIAAYEEGCEALARTVLESLNIEWDGSWEWKVDWATTKSELQARTWARKQEQQLQRRPDIAVRWSDVSE